MIINSAHGIIKKVAKHFLGITVLSTLGNTIQLTIDRKEFKIQLNGDSTKVWVDGIRYSRDGSTEIQVRVAPVIFEEPVFIQVDDLIASGKSTKGACEEVAEQYGYKPESFRQQYYKRHASQKRNVKPCGL